jgi:hypothetical protein
MSSDNDSGSNEIVAYSERPSSDPITAEEGVLRVEWRLTPVTSVAREALEQAFGPRWDSHLASRPVLVESRRIKRGRAYAWEIYDAARTQDEAFYYIANSGEYIALNSRLKQVQVARQEAKNKAEAEELIAADTKEKARCRALQEAKSEAAFVRLSESKDAVWAERWKAFVRRHYINEDMIARIKANQTLYDAVVTAVTVPAKRKAIKAFLAKYDS